LNVLIFEEEQEKKVMKDTKFYKGCDWMTRLMSFISVLFLNIFAAYSAMTCSGGEKWNGNYPTLEVLGNYVVITTDGFNGTILFEGVTFGDKADFSRTRAFNQVYLNQIQTNEYITGKYCAYFDEERETIVVLDDGFTGAIAYSSKSVCRGAEAELWAVDVDLTTYNLEWGVVQSAGDTLWLAENKNKIGITYSIDDVKPFMFVTKVTSKSGGTQFINSLTVSPTLENCGYFITNSASSICLSESVTLSSSYTSGKSYQWKDDKGNDYGVNTTAELTVTPQTSGTYEFSLYADELKVGSAKIVVKPMSECGYKVTAKKGYACQGGSDLLSTNFDKASVYTWRTGSTVVAVTSEPQVNVKPTETTTYSLYADNYYVGEVEVESHECSFFIASQFPIESCLQDTNILIASGTAVLSDINSEAFQWYVSKDKENWTLLRRANTYRLPVWMDDDYYYRVDFEGLSDTIYYPKPNCSSQEYCDGLETKTLFYETFGFFMSDDVYVTEGEIYQSSVDVDHLTTVRLDRTGDELTSGDYDAGGAYFSARASGGDEMSVDTTKTNNFSIRNYVSPDPNGYVVTATKFVNVDGNGANQFVGTDGHLYMTENPMLSQYEADTWIKDASLRLQDGYYAIVRSPDSCDHNKNHKDFIACSDYTGNKNGAMLFVNAGQTNISKAAIYAQKASLSCPADRFNFGMSVRNATNIEAGEYKNAVNLTICLLKEFNESARTLPSSGDSNVLASISSGDVAAGLDSWTRLDEFIHLDEKVKDVWVVIYNNGEPGDGNDMLLDDITFSVCIPKAKLKAILNGDTLESEVVSCSGEEVTLHAYQTSSYIQNPLYIFQYQNATGSDTVWTDLNDYANNPSLMKIDTATVSTNDATFAGALNYRVIVSDDAEVARKVADGLMSSLTECEFTFHQATTDITIRNTYGGEMAPRDSVAFCNIPGEEVIISGERLLISPEHEWTMSWLAADSTLLFSKDVKGVSKDSLKLVVLEGDSFSVTASDGTQLGVFAFAQFDSLIFKAVDEGDCEFYQNIVTHAKMNLNIQAEAQSVVDCNTATVKVIRNYSEPSLVFDWSSLPGKVTVIDDSTQTFEPDNLSNYSYLQGVVKINPVNVDDKYCFLQNSLEVPYTIHNGHYTMKIRSSKDPVCVSKSDMSLDASILTLEAYVDPTMGAAEAAKIDEKITSYSWHIVFSDGSILDTVTATRKLSFTNADLLNSTRDQIRADEVSAYISATTSDVCETITHDINQSKLSIEIREGGFSLYMNSVYSVCLLDKKSHDLEVVISPATALLSINKLDLYMNGSKLKELTDLKDTFTVTLDDATYPSIFKSGNTASYLLSVYDSTCKSNNESNQVVVKYNGYDWKFNKPDSCLTEDNNVFNIVATIDSVNAVNHIRSYIWTLDGDTLPGSGFGLTYDYVVPKSMKGNFKLVTEDGICPAVEHEFTSKIGIKYKLELTSDVNKVCSTDQALINTVVTPESSRKFINRYRWYVVDTLNNEFLMKDAGSTGTTMELTSAQYPSLFSPGNSFKVYVVADDNICLSAESEKPLVFDVNVPFTLDLTSSSYKICYQEGTKVKLNAIVSPADAIHHIDHFYWTRNGNDKSLTYVTTEPYLEISDLEGWMQPGDNISFSVSASDGICVSASDPARASTLVDINTPYSVTLTTDKRFACSKDDQVVLIGTNSQSGDKYVSYKYEFISAFNDSVYNLKNPLNNMYCVDEMNSYKGFVPGSAVNYALVVSDNGACGPVTAYADPVVIQTPYKVHIEASKYNVCQYEQSVISLATFEPAEAQNFLKMYSWQMAESNIGSVGNLSLPYVSPSYVPGYDKFFANISDGICYGTEKFPPLQSDTVTIKVYQPIMATLASSSAVFCESPESVPVVLTATSWSGEPLRYELYDRYNGTLLSQVDTKEMSYTWELAPSQTVNQYVVYVYDGVCPIATDINGGVLIDVHTPMIFNVTLPEEDYNICLGDTVHMTTNVFQGNPVAYSWLGLSVDPLTPVGIASYINTMNDSPKYPGEVYYSITAVDMVCPDVSYLVGPITVYNPPKVQLVASQDEVVIGGRLNFEAQVLQGNPIVYEWKVNDNTIAVTQENVLNDYLPRSSSEYKVYVSDGYCPSSYSSLEIDVKIPTAFTPHHKDGRNDVFMEGYYMMIFDRYGHKVFEGDNGWDGTKGNVMADPGIYYCNIQLKDGTVYKGTVEIIKID
jgi:hypothetical protein